MRMKGKKMPAKKKWAAKTPKPPSKRKYNTMVKVVARNKRSERLRFLKLKEELQKHKEGEGAGQEQSGEENKKEQDSEATTGGDCTAEKNGSGPNGTKQITEEERQAKLAELESKLQAHIEQKHKLFLLLKQVLSVDEKKKKKQAEEERLRLEEQRRFALNRLFFAITVFTPHKLQLMTTLPLEPRRRGGSLSSRLCEMQVRTLLTA